MDANRFDALSRHLTRSGSRRGALKSLVGSALGGLLGLRGWGEASATHGCRHTEANCTRPGQCCSGRCAGNGTCQLCTSASQCPAPPASEPCQQRVCTSKGKCVVRNKQDGVGCATGMVCLTGQCVTCGDENEPCCATDPPCEGSIENGDQKTCHPVTKTCHLCAESVGSPCCPGNECFQPGVLVCEDGICQGAGGGGGK